MVFKNKFHFLTFFILFGNPLLAEQIPYIYTNGGTIDTNLSRCVSTAKKEMRLGNFTKNLQIVYDEDNSHSATIRSEHSYKPVSITYRCMTDINTWTFGIGSVDHEEAWNSYKYFYEKIKGVTKN
tara:strand:- start:717 stop:1091 length:375 start_codon:yes stop_codon:yes gene_type:complete